MLRTVTDIVWEYCVSMKEEFLNSVWRLRVRKDSVAFYYKVFKTADSKKEAVGAAALS